MDLDDIFDIDSEDYARYPQDTDGLYSPLSSEESMRTSLEDIRSGRAGLNKHRQSLLNRIPEQNSWHPFPLNTVEDKDLAYLSAETGDEFALLRGKREDIFFHGTPRNCHLEKEETLMDMLYSKKFGLEIHSHPDRGPLTASQQDRDFIRSIGQKESKIISSYTGKIIPFRANIFEDL